MIGVQELILIFAILLIVFGPKKVPVIAKELGKALQEFKKASSNIVDTASSALSNEEDNVKTIKQIANNLGVDTKEKSTKQLLDEIQSKIVKNKEGTDIQKDR